MYYELLGCADFYAGCSLRRFGWDERSDCFQDSFDLLIKMLVGYHIVWYSLFASILVLVPSLVLCDMFSSHIPKAC